MNNPLVSLIINNYNYSNYVGIAIDSALNQSYSNIEVIVVDDGSTDNSRSIIEDYNNKIKYLFKENGGQASAYNSGFRFCKGDIILFLDADDYLHQDAIHYVVEAFTEKVVKVQYRLEIVDHKGKATGIWIPSNHMPNGNVLDILLKYRGYGSPPASGNVYLKSALKRIFPIPEAEWRIAADTVPAIAAPFCGNVASLNRVLGYYRVHNSFKENGSNTNAMRPGNVASLNGKIEEIIKTEIFIKEQCDLHNKNYNPELMQNNPSILKLLICQKIVEPNNYYIMHYNLKELAFKGIKASIKFPLYSLFQKALISFWFFFIFLSPYPIKKILVSLGLQPMKRYFNI